MPRLTVEEAIHTLRKALTVIYNDMSAAQRAMLLIQDWMRTLDRSRLAGDFGRAEAYFSYILAELSIAHMMTPQFRPDGVADKLRSAIKMMENHERLLRIANKEDPPQAFTTAQMIGAVVIIGIVAIPVAIVAVEALGAAALISAASLAARATAAARLGILVCKHPAVAAEIAGITAGTAVSLGESGFSASQGIDVFLIFLAVRSTGGGVRWSRITARRTQSGFRVESIELVDGPPRGTAPVNLQPSVVKPQVRIDSLVESARDAARLAQTIPHRSSGVPVSPNQRGGRAIFLRGRTAAVIRATNESDAPGISAMARKPICAIDPNVKLTAEIIELGLRAARERAKQLGLPTQGLKGWDGNCAEPLAISNMIREGTPTDGAVSCAIDVKTLGIKDPCPNCTQLLRMFNMWWIDKSGELKN